MHYAFIPYGKKSEVELLISDMEAQKHLLPMTKGKEGDKDYIKQGRYIQSQVRILPGGVYEYVFPKEDLDLVLFTLEATPNNPYNIGDVKLKFIRKFLDLKPIPEFKKDKQFLWIKDNVSIISLGIREDKEITEKDGIFKGFTHEAI
jgi:hypothetical protein